VTADGECQPPAFDRDAAAAECLPRVELYARKVADDRGRPDLYDKLYDAAIDDLLWCLAKYEPAKGKPFRAFWAGRLRLVVTREFNNAVGAEAGRPSARPLVESDAAREPVPCELSEETVARLTAEEREAVELVFVGGWPVEDAAAVLGCSTGTLVGRLKAAALALAPGRGEPGPFKLEAWKPPRDRRRKPGAGASLYPAGS
jgi:predicted DNA-binding protein (UPF0251 family)